MKKTILIICIIIVIILIIFFGFKWFQHNDTPSTNDTNTLSSEYNATRTTTNTNNTTNIQTPHFTNEIFSQPTQTELYSFSTPIKSKDSNRLTNIKITCSRINETVVKANKEFSFCDTVGQPKSKDGYKPADAFGSAGEIIKAIGGGNCQVSTTIYNAALGVDGLKITERHEHERDVAYIEDGKDATVAYDYLDLKFKNTNNFDIKLTASVSDDKVIVKIYRVS